MTAMIATTAAIVTTTAATTANPAPPTVRRVDGCAVHASNHQTLYHDAPLI